MTLPPGCVVVDGVGVAVEPGGTVAVAVPVAPGTSDGVGVADEPGNEVAVGVAGMVEPGSSVQVGVGEMAGVSDVAVGVAVGASGIARAMLK